MDLVSATASAARVCSPRARSTGAWLSSATRQLDGLAEGPREGDAAFDQRQCLPGPAARRERYSERQRSHADDLPGAVLPDEFGCRLGQHPLLVKTGPDRRRSTTGRPARPRRPSHCALAGASAADSANHRSASSRLTPEVQAGADRPARQWPPWRPGALELGRPAAVIQLGADITPRKAGPQHRQARLSPS